MCKVLFLIITHIYIIIFLNNSKQLKIINRYMMKTPCFMFLKAEHDIKQFFSCQTFFQFFFNLKNIKLFSKIVVK